MTADPYSARTRELFGDLRHVAAKPGEPGDGESVYVEGQGVRLRLNARADDGHIATLRFRAYGCPHFVAACEWLCRNLEGRPVSALGEWRPSEIMQTLGLPVEKTGRILVLEDAVRELGTCLGGAAPT